MLDGQFVQDELARLEEKRRERTWAAEERTRAFLLRHPDVDRAFRLMKKAHIHVARQVLSGAADPAEARLAGERYQSLYAAALAAEGLTPEALQPDWDCPRCRDTGYVGETEKNLCACVVTAVLARMSHSARLRPECTFAGWDFSVFPQSTFVSGKPFNQRRQMEELHEYCNRWIDAFPANRRPHMLLTGGVGLGKTFLLHAVAHRIIEEKQVAVLTTTAYHIIAEARNGFDALGNIEVYLKAPVLIIDDLGTEPVIPSLSAETMFTVVNERQSCGRHTLIATNLSLADLGSRYDERLLSRLTRRETFVKCLQGRDIRVR